MADVEYGEIGEQEDSPANAKDEALVTKWLNEVVAAEKREKPWRNSAKEVICLYEADKKKEYQFNILYSNTETLAPALYSTTPEPVVQRRFKDDDPVGGAASKVLQRTLAFLIDDGASIYANFDTLMTSSVLDGLVPGRGITRFKYDAYFVPVETPDDGQIQAQEGRELPGTPEDKLSDPQLRVDWETICGEQIPWDRFCHGYGRTWQEVPWVAYKWLMTRDEIKKNFGAEVASRVTYQSLSDDEIDGTKTSTDADIVKDLKAAWVYEIWDKRTKKIYFISEGYKFGPLKDPVDDPLGLTGFFDCPEPLKFFNRVSGLTPQTLYAFYEEQAKELNQITFRINRIVKAIKVRGVYDGSITELARIFQEDDNALLPAENVTAMYDRGGLEAAIWLLPIDKLVLTLQQLYVAREQSKQVIYEITGLSDILRGSSNPNETLGAQKIKDQWGNLRLRKQQKRVQKYCVDCLRIMAEIACGKFGPETLAQMTNLKFPQQDEKDAAVQGMQLLQQMEAQGQPADPSLMQQFQEVLSKPSWEEIMSILTNDLQRTYRIDIESNSTIEPEATEDKESMMGLMNALSQFLLGVQPLVADGSLPFEAMKAILMTICRRFNFGPQVEDELKKMQPPQKQEDPEIQKQRDELAKKEEDLQKREAGLAIQDTQNDLKQQFDQFKSEAQTQLQAKEAELDAAIQEVEMAGKLQRQEVQMELEKVISDLRIKVAERMNQLEMDSAKQDAEIEQDFRDAMADADRSNADAEANRQRAADKGKEE